MYAIINFYFWESLTTCSLGGQWTFLSSYSIFHFWLILLQMGESKNSQTASVGDVEDLIHNFLIIMLEHSMRQKDGWKVKFYFPVLSHKTGSILFYFVRDRDKSYKRG